MKLGASREKTPLLSRTSPFDQEQEEPEERHRRAKKSKHHLWALVTGGAILILAVIMAIVHSFVQPIPDIPQISVAFVGNSMLYYNDMPRLLQRLSYDRIYQDSCLHGDASLNSILVTGNGMYQKFNTSNAHIKKDLYDFGQCTVPQLLLGNDPALDHEMIQISQNNTNDGSSSSTSSTTNITYLANDGSNPCLRNPHYLAYLDKINAEFPTKWDYIVMNDNTRNPGRDGTRAAGIDVLLHTYLPMFHQTGAVPVFLDTHAYFTPTRDLTGLGDIPQFTSLTYEGYRQYVAALSPHLPKSQQPLIAPAGIAYLTIWEENHSLWEKLFHSDSVHASPLGSFLEACIIYYTLYGKMPAKEAAIHDNMSILWAKARVMQEFGQPRNPFPTREEGEYLYDIADRVARQGYRPSTFQSFS